jgi:antitoxin MazE
MLYHRCYNGITVYIILAVTAMIKKLSKHGNSLALVIDRSILELLGIDEKTSLELSTDGESLVIAPLRDKKRKKKFEEALTSSNERYGRALKRLAE